MSKGHESVSSPHLIGQQIECIMFLDLTLVVAQKCSREMYSII